MNHSSRIPGLAALAAGFFLIALGLLRTPGNGPGADQVAASAPDDLSALPRPEGRPERIESEPTLSSPVDSVVVDSSTDADTLEETVIVARLNYSSDRAAAPRAQVGLWRRETGEGASFRPAKRLTELTTDEAGVVRLIAPPDMPLDIYARAESGGPTVRVALPPLSKGESRAIAVTVERPPAPLDLVVRDSATGDPVVGAAIRTVPFEQSHLGITDFPGTTRLVQRTDGEGKVDLPGETREAHWMLIDAAGYSPTALLPSSLDGRTSSEVLLERASKVTVEVVDPSGAALNDIEICMTASLSGYQTTFTAMTNRRGEASFPRLPSGVPLMPTAGAVDDIPGLFDALTLQPLEERALRLELDPR